MISLSAAQLKTVMATAVHVPVERRSQFLQRVAVILDLCGRGHFDDAAVADAMARALTGMSHLGSDLSELKNKTSSH